MCLIAFNWNNDPVYKMILVANRDEYYNRPSSPLHLWEEGFYAGRDLKGGGTWMGMHPNGRFAALTNYRGKSLDVESPASRGELVVDFLKGNRTALDHLSRLQQRKNHFLGFSLLISDGEKMYYLSNYQENIQEVTPGIHGLSNSLLNTPWPKVQDAKHELSAYLLKTESPDIGSLVGLLQSTTPAPVEMLPDSGLSPTMELALSAQFIAVNDSYGTVNTTAVLWGHNGEVLIREVGLVPDERETTAQFMVEPS